MNTASLAIATILGCVLLSGALPSAAGLADGVALPAGNLTLEVSDATISVKIVDGGAGQLRASAPEEGVDPDSLLEVVQGAGGIRVVRRADAPSPAPRLVLEVTVEPTRSISVRGQSVEARVERAGASTDGPPEGGAQQGAAPGAATGVAVSFSLERSSLALAGIGQAQGTATDSTVTVTGGAGLLDLNLSGGAAEIRERMGSLRLVGNQTPIVLAGITAQTDAELVGGSLDGQDGKGNVTARLNGAQLQLDDWKGTVVVTGGDATVALRRLTAPQVSLTLTNTNVTADDVGGTFRVQLTGGSLQGSSLTGKTILTASDRASIGVDGVTGDVELQLRGDADARLDRVSGNLVATTQSSRIDASEVGGLSLAAFSSDVTVTQPGRVDKLNLTDCQARVDLTNLHGTVQVALSGASRADVDLSSPCLVTGKGANAVMGDQIQVSGCELQLPGRRGAGRPLALGPELAQRQTQLRAVLSGEASLSVQGR